MMKRILLASSLVILQACGSSGGGGGGQPAGPGPGQPPAENPGSGGQESVNYFSNIDRAISSSAKGDKFVSERFYVVMSRLSVYAMICDFKNELGYSAQVSKLWNASTELQALAEKVYGGEKAAYNRFEKQRNIESNRLSFESGPNACALGKDSFIDYARLSAADLSRTVRTTARGSL